MKKTFLNFNILYILAIVFTITLPAYLYFRFYGDPIVESHAYRQTQTAIVAFWMLRDGFRVLDYLMPVLGYPWSSPLEFPLYQLIVAQIVQVTGFNLEITGRFISLFFYYICLIPIFFILKNYGRNAFYISLILYLTSPVGLIYSRSFLIENLAVFFSLVTFAIYIRIRRCNSIDIYYYLLVGLFTITGAISGLQKITTFFPVFLVCFVDNLTGLKFKADFFRINIRVVIFNLFLGVSLLPSLIYSKYSDSIKRTGSITEYLISSSQFSWIFGDLNLRLSLEYWLKVFGFRFIILGGLLLTVIWTLYIAVKQKKFINREAGLSIFIGLLGPIIFGPLFYVHDYYLIASISFIIVGLSIFISQNIIINFKNMIIIYMIIIFNYFIFSTKFLPKLRDYSQLDRTSIQVGKFLKSHLKDGEASLILGMDWSSVIPYYSEHYAIMIPSWLPNKSYVIQNAKNYSGEYKIGAFVICSNDIWPIDISPIELSEILNKINGLKVNIGSCKIILNY